MYWREEFKASRGKKEKETGRRKHNLEVGKESNKKSKRGNGNRIGLIKETPKNPCKDGKTRITI